VFSITLNQDPDPTTVDEQSVALVPTERVSKTFMSDFDKPPLSAERQEQLLAAGVSIEGAHILLRPDENLPVSTELTLVLSKALKSVSGMTFVNDRAQEASFRLDLRTLGAPPSILSTSLPRGQPSLVPPNLRSFTMTSDKPLYNVSPQAVVLLGLEGTPDVTVDRVTLAADGTVLRIWLADAGQCQPLCTNAKYRLVAGAPLSDEDGQPLTTLEFDVQALDAPDVQGPLLSALPFVQSAEDHVFFRIGTTEPIQGRLLAGPAGGPYGDNALGQGVASTLTLSELQACEGAGAARACSFGTLVSGLDLGPSAGGRTYGAMLELTDDFGNLSVFGEFELKTLKLPLLKITEVYLNPPDTSAPEGEQEFIEVTNTSSSVTYDFALMSVATLDRSSGAETSVMFLRPYLSQLGTLLAPGERAVIGGAQFNPDLVGVPPDTIILVDQEARTTLMGGLPSSLSSRKLVALFQGDPEAGAPRVSIFTAPEALFNAGSSFPEGMSAERVELENHDDTALWCHSNGPPTPGLQNRVHGLSECPQEAF
jgi:hypothetical protein